MRIDRMLAITVLLLHKQRVSARELANKFEVSIRTVYRDFEAISAAGIPVVSYPGINGGFGIIDNYKIDRRILTLQDMVSILSALKGINAAFDDDKVGNAIDKISSLIPHDKTQQIEQQLEQIIIDLMPWGFKDKHKESLKLIQRSISNQKLIKFIYENTRFEILARTVEPMTLIFKGFTWYLFAYCHARNDYRLFRISRMKNITLLTENFQRRQISYHDYSNGSNDRNNWVTITLKFSADVRMRVEEYFENEIINTMDNGNLIVRVSLPQDDWIYSSILSFGEYVEVLEPEKLRLIIADKAKKIWSLYNHDNRVSQDGVRLAVHI